MYTDVGSKYGMARVQLVGSDAHAASNGAVAGGQPGTHSVENPMMWLLGIGAVTIGLIAFSTHVRVGKFSASVTAGKG